MNREESAKLLEEISSYIGKQMNREESAKLLEEISSYIGKDFYAISSTDYRSERDKTEHPDVPDTFHVAVFSRVDMVGCVAVMSSEREWKRFKKFCQVIVLSIQEKE